MLLFTGDQVTVSGARGIVQAEVIHTEIPAALPSINGAEELRQVQAIMAERGVVQLAMLAYDFTGPAVLTSGGRPVKMKSGKNQVVFAALLNGAGEWHDLQGQQLTITTREADDACHDEQSSSSDPHPSE